MERRPEAASKPLPRFIGDQEADPLIITVWVLLSGLKHDFSKPELALLKKGESEDKPRAIVRPAWNKLWNHRVQTRYYEVVRLLQPGERWLPIHKALERLPEAELCAPQRIAEEMGEAQWRPIRMAAGQPPELRLHCFGTAWEEPAGCTRVPILRIEAGRASFDTDWCDNLRLHSENIWTACDLALLAVLKPPAA